GADGRLGDADLVRDAPERLAPVLLQRLDDRLVDRVERARAADWSTVGHCAEHPAQPRIPSSRTGEVAQIRGPGAQISPNALAVVEDGLRLDAHDHTVDRRMEGLALVLP